MSISFITHEDLDNTPVANAMMADLALHLTTHLSTKISILSASKKCVSYQKNNINYETFQRSRKGQAGLKEVFEFSKAYKKAFTMIKNSEVIIFRSYPSIFMFGIIAKILHKEIIFDTRGLWCKELIDSGKLKESSWILKALNYLEKFWLKNSNVTICVTSYQNEYYENKHSLKLNSFIIGNGAKSPLSTENIRNKNELNLLYVGSLIKWHCIDFIRAICAELAKQVNVNLTLLTKQKDLGEKIFKDVAFKTNIQEQDFRNNGIKADYAFCLIKGGISKEICYPVKLNEYLANGNKVIASNNVKIHKDIINEENGILVDINTDIATIASTIMSDYQKTSSEPVFTFFTYDEQVSKWLKILTKKSFAIS